MVCKHIYIAQHMDYISIVYLYICLYMDHYRYIQIHYLSIYYIDTCIRSTTFLHSGLIYRNTSGPEFVISSGHRLVHSSLEAPQEQVKPLNICGNILRYSTYFDICLYVSIESQVATTVVNKWFGVMFYWHCVNSMKYTQSRVQACLYPKKCSSFQPIILLWLRNRNTFNFYGSFLEKKNSFYG